MLKILQISVVASVILNQCVSFQPVVLDDDGYKEKIAARQASPSALTYKRGDLLKQANWSSQETTVLTSENGVLKLTNSSGGNNANTIVTPLKGLDFRGAVAVKVKARSVGVPSKLKLIFKDGEGRMSNGRSLVRKVEVGEGFQNYYFDLDGSFVQTYPETATVNAAQITELELVSKQITGADNRLEIQEIQMILASAIVEKKKVIAEGQSTGEILWGSAEGWQVDKGYELTGSEETLSIKASKVGPKYEALSTSIPTASFAVNQKLTLDMSYEGEVAPFIRVDLVDNNGVVTNRLPLSIQLKETSKNKFESYTLDYTDRFKQSYPQVTDVDAARIVKMVVYVNAGHYPYSGNVNLKMPKIIQ